MGLSKDDIIDLASRYVSSDEITEFPFEGDLFCLLIRAVPENKVLSDEEGWAFRSYGICIGYTYDEEAKPRGKWLFMHFASLESFPPVAQVLKLQPPHVVKARFQNPERTHEIRILKVNLSQVTSILNSIDQKEEVKEQVEQPVLEEKHDKKIVQFRRKTTK